MPLSLAGRDPYRIDRESDMGIIRIADLPDRRNG
jgi:hypothetical protein